MLMLLRLIVVVSVDGVVGNVCCRLIDYDDSCVVVVDVLL